jgi:alkylhydroperoxidase family enzyme
MRIPLAPTEGPGAAAEAVAQIAARRSGRVTKLFKTLLHSGDLAAGWCELGTAVRYQLALDDRLRELLTCQVAQRTAAAYEWANHAPLARAQGITDDELDSLPEWRSCASFSDRDRAALELADAVVAGRVTDDVFATASAHFDHRGLVEIAGTAAYYLAVSRILQSFGVEPDQPHT